MVVIFCEHVKRWLRKAEENLRLAEAALREDPFAFSCFHSQQASAGVEGSHHPSEGVSPIYSSSHRAGGIIRGARDIGQSRDSDGAEEAEGEADGEGGIHFEEGCEVSKASAPLEGC